MDIISLFTEQYNERDVEIGLVKHVEKFLVEMGAGFAFMGRQYHIEVSGDDYYIDILMYNTFLHRYLVIELKDTEFMSEYIGKLNFYCSAKAKTASRLNTPCVTFRSRSGYLTMNWDKPYSIVDSIEDFNEGDVVVVNKQGEIIFVYEINSHHNALMATERCNHRCIMCPQPPILQEKDKTPFNLKLISLR